MFTVAGMGLGKNLAKLRADRKMTLDDLSAASGVGRSAIHAIEKRDSKTSAHATALARAFGITVDQLLADDLPSGAAQQVAAVPIGDPEIGQAIDDLSDLAKLDPDTRAKILSDLHNAADRARAIARRATQQTKPAAAMPQRRGGGTRSELTIRLGDGNPDQGSLELRISDDPFSAQPDPRELELYQRIAKNRVHRQ